MLAARLLRQCIDSQKHLSEDEPEPNSDLTDTVDSDKIQNTNSIPFYRPALGAPCRPMPLQGFETQNVTDSAFTGIRKKFTEFLNSSVHAWGYQVANYIRIPPSFEVSYHTFLIA